MPYLSDVKKADRTEEAEAFPKAILIDNCSACNLRCNMCDHVNIQKYRKIQRMDWGLYTKIVDEIADVAPDTRVWQIFFGDPFMCGDMPRRISYAKDQGLTDVVLNSNGMRMTAGRARAFIEAGLDAMYVGVDAADPKTYEQVRIGGDFDTVVANVLGYRDLLRRHGRSGQELFVQFVVTEENERELEDFTLFWKAAGVSVKIRPKISWAGLVNAANLQANATVARKPCYWLMQTMNICADGHVALCSVDLHCRVASGDAAQQSLREIWNGTLREYRELHRQGRFDELPDMCRHCADWQSAYADFDLAAAHDPSGDKSS